MPLDPATRRLLKIWGVKIAGTAYLLFVFAFMAAHPQPDSMASLSYALSLAIVPAAVATLAVLGVLVFLHKRSSAPGTISPLFFRPPSGTAPRRTPGPVAP